jgi:cytochrome c oxidase subunit 2
MISGKVNRMWIEADEPGRFRGQCAEYCGLQHAKMIFYVVAQREDDFEAWLANEAKEAADPADPGAVAGEEVFMNETCAGCHAIRGTDADAQLGPDLTHLAARATIAAGVLDNTRADLAEWIVDPQGVKDGASMPPSELSAQELDDLLDYLESLE